MHQLLAVGAGGLLVNAMKVEPRPTPTVMPPAGDIVGPEQEALVSSADPATAVPVEQRQAGARVGQEIPHSDETSMKPARGFGRKGRCSNQHAVADYCCL